MTQLKGGEREGTTTGTGARGVDHRCQSHPINGEKASVFIKNFQQLQNLLRDPLLASGKLTESEEKLQRFESSCGDCFFQALLLGINPQPKDWIALLVFVIFVCSCFGVSSVHTTSSRKEENHLSLVLTNQRVIMNFFLFLSALRIGFVEGKVKADGQCLKNVEKYEG